MTKVEGENSLDALDSQLFDSIEYDIVNWLGGGKEQSEFAVQEITSL